MKRKWVVLLAGVLMTLCMGMAAMNVSAAETLEIQAVNKADPGWGMSVMVQTSKDSGTYPWQNPVTVEKDKIVYVDSNGEDVLGTVEPFGNNVAINRGGRAAQVGDVLTIKAGFEYDGAVTEADVTYYFVAEGSPWTTEKPDDPVDPPVEEDVIIGIDHIHCEKGNTWGWPAMTTQFVNAKGDYAQYWAADKSKVSYENAFGESMEISDVTYVGSNNFIVRLSDQTYIPMVGDKLTFHADFVLHDYEKLAGEITYVVTTEGSGNMTLIEDVTFADTLTITNDPSEGTIPAEAALQLTYTLPENTIGTPYFTSSDEETATVTKAGGLVTGVKEGTATITAHIGGKTFDYEVTIIAKQNISGIEILNNYAVYVVKGEEIAWPTDWTAQVKFESGIGGAQFEVVAGENLILPEGGVDTSAAGTQEISANILYHEAEYPVTLTVEVYELTDMLIKEVGIVDWFSYATFIQIPDSGINLGNIQTDAQLTDMLTYVRYERADGTEVKVNGLWNLGTNLALLIFNDLDENNYNDYYLPGDKIILAEGFYSLLWTGQLAPTATDDHAISPGTGMVVKDCVLREETIYQYDGTTWGIYIEYSELTAAAEELEVVIGKAVSSGVSRVPANATVGEITYTSSNEQVATVNTLGVIRGHSEGEATITATINGGVAGEKTVTIKVTVKDGITGLEFTPDTLSVALGQALDLSKVSAKFVMASGIEGEAVDLTNAQISGYNADKSGDQTVVISVTVDGEVYSGTLKVTVGSSDGCGSCNASAGMALFGLLALGVLGLKKL